MTPADIKQWGIVGVVTLYTVLFFLAFGLLIGPGMTNQILLVLLLVLALVEVALLAFSFSLVSIKNKGALLVVVPFLMTVLIGGFGVHALVGAALLLAGLSTGAHTISGTIKNRIAFKTPDIFMLGSRYITLGLLSALIALLFPLLLSAAEGAQVESKHLVPLLRPLEPALGQLTGGYRISQRIDDINPQLDRQQRDALHQQLSQQYGTQVTGQESILDLVAAQFNQVLRTLTRNQRIIFILTAIILFYTAVRIFIPLLLWPIMGLILATIWLGRHAGVVTVSETPATVQRLVIT
jgi:hypothetical protein